MDHRYEALIGRCGGIKDMELGWLVCMDHRYEAWLVGMDGS